jgi:uncharacterized PurR-regulated membrane protein YhhQ (DUF165 family)
MTDKMQVYPKYFLFFAIAFVTVLLVPIAVAYHIDEIGPFVLSGGALVFPLAYLLADIIAEVYGYRFVR